VAEVVVKPVGVTQAATLAVVQYKNWIEPTLPPVGTVKAKEWLTTPLGLEPPSLAPAMRVILRLVICVAAEAGSEGNITKARNSSATKPALNPTRTLPFKLMAQYYHEHLEIVKRISLFLSTGVY
jgi:hypothetical protein